MGRVGNNQFKYSIQQSKSNWFPVEFNLSRHLQSHRCWNWGGDTGGASPSIILIGEHNGKNPTQWLAVSAEVFLFMAFRGNSSSCYCYVSTVHESRKKVLHWYRPTFHTPVPSTRQHPSYGDCLEVNREYYQDSSVLDCVTQCSQSTAHLYEQFLQVQQIGYVTLRPLHCAWRRLPRVVVL